MYLPFKSGFKVTQSYGENPKYYQQISNGGLTAHEGDDLIPRDSSDLEVLNLFDGVVVRDEDSPKVSAYGIYIVVLSLDLRFALWYCHLKENRFEIGDTVKEGQILGLMGATGNTTGPHLHLMRRNSDANGNAINLDNGYQGFESAMSLITDKMFKQKGGQYVYSVKELHGLMAEAIDNKRWE